MVKRNAMLESRLGPGESIQYVSNPLSECEDVVRLRSICQKLWDLLDDIDTLDDAVKPGCEQGLRLFRNQALRLASLRHDCAVCDMDELYLDTEVPDEC